MGFPYPYPLGLPKGSVRATLTLLLSVNLIVLSINQDPIAVNMSTLVAVALTFYFGGKMRTPSPVPTSVEASQRAWGLPAGTIRFILILLFGGAAYYIRFVQEKPLENFFIDIIYIILGYLIGTSFNKIKSIFIKTKDDGVDFVDHLKALLALGITGYVVYLAQIDPSSQLTKDISFITSIFLGFYFGSRQ